MAPDFREAATAFYDSFSTTFPDDSHSDEEQRILTVGASLRGSILVIAHTEESDTIRIISARLATPSERRFYERELNTIRTATSAPKYDFARIKGGIRGKYVKSLREQSNIVVLEPDIADAFPNEEAVNQALRGVLDTARAVRSRGGLREKSLRARPSRNRKK